MQILWHYSLNSQSINPTNTTAIIVHTPMPSLDAPLDFDVVVAGAAPVPDGLSPLVLVAIGVGGTLGFIASGKAAYTLASVLLTLANEHHPSY